MSAKTRKRRKAPAFRTPTTTTGHGPSVETLIQQRDKDRNELDDLKTEITGLRAENKTLREQADVGSRTRADDSTAVIDRVARSLLLASKAADPRTGRNIGLIPNRSTDDPAPGEGTKTPRYHARKLVGRLVKACADFDNAAEHYWFPPKHATEEKVRCCNRKCVAKDKRIPRFVGPRGAGRIELTHCPKCNQKLVSV